MQKHDVADLILKKLDELGTRIDTVMTQALYKGTEKALLNKKTTLGEIEDMLRARETILKNIEDNEIDLEKINMGILLDDRSMDVLLRGQKLLSDNEKLEKQRIILTEKINRDTAKMRLLDRGLENVKSENFYKIIEYKYYSNMSNDEIARQMMISISDVLRQTTYLLKKMSWRMYSTEVL